MNRVTLLVPDYSVNLEEHGRSLREYLWECRRIVAEVLRKNTGEVQEVILIDYAREHPRTVYVDVYAEANEEQLEELRLQVPCVPLAINWLKPHVNVIAL